MGFKNYVYIYLFMAVLGLCCFEWTSSVFRKQGLFFFVVQRLLISVASLVTHGLQGMELLVTVAFRLRSFGCGPQSMLASVAVAYGLQNVGSIIVAQGLSCFEACGIFPGHELNLCPLPALAGGFLIHSTTREVPILILGMIILKKFLLPHILRNNSCSYKFISKQKY